MKSSFFVRMLLLSLATASVLPSQAQVAPSQKARNAHCSPSFGLPRVWLLKATSSTAESPRDASRQPFGA